MEEKLLIAYVQVIKRVVEGWKLHPAYDGRADHPVCRACCRVRETLSYSITPFEEAWRHLNRMAKHAGKLYDECSFTIEPLEPTDPIHPYLILDCWNIPTAARTSYLARETFKQRFPELAPMLNQARRFFAKPAPRHPDTKRKTNKALAFRLWATDQPALMKQLKRYMLSLDEIWDIANGRIPIDEIDKLGIYQFQQTLF